MRISRTLTTVSRLTAICVCLTGGLVGGISAQQTNAEEEETYMRRPVVIATWPFGKPCNEAAERVLKAGGSALDAVEQGIWVAELDKTNSTVGLGGSPNSHGVVQLDAAVMWGPGHRAGSVAALERILHPISVARKVMEETPHVMLVGAGALAFALSRGFPLEEAVSEESRRRYEEWKKRQAQPHENHDTIGMVAIDGNGDIAAGSSTSGYAFKLPGRVGDSPIIGSGLYADNEIGGAAATGNGEDIMRYCTSFAVVEKMGQGMSPEEACVSVLKWIVSKDPNGKSTSIGVIALNKAGECGAASVRKGFPYAVYTDGKHYLKRGKSVVR